VVDIRVVALKRDLANLIQYYNSRKSAVISAHHGMKLERRIFSNMLLVSRSY